MEKLEIEGKTSHLQINVLIHNRRGHPAVVVVNVAVVSLVNIAAVAVVSVAAVAVIERADLIDYLPSLVLLKNCLKQCLKS